MDQLCPTRVATLVRQVQNPEDVVFVVQEEWTVGWWLLVGFLVCVLAAEKGGISSFTLLEPQYTD